MLKAYDTDGLSSEERDVMFQREESQKFVIIIYMIKKW